MTKEIIKKAGQAVYTYTYQEMYLKGRLKDNLKESFESIEFKPFKEMEDVLIIEDFDSRPDRRVEGACFINEDDLYIVFSATNDLEDWITNFKMGKPPLWNDDNEAVLPYEETNPAIQTHKGYTERYKLNTVRDKIHEYVERYPDKNIIVTGYSMGGGIAPICAIDVQYHFREKMEVACVSFAGPKVGNAEFIASAENRIDWVHLAMYRDPVPALPPDILGFYHPSNILRYGEKKKKIFDYSPKEHYPHVLFGAIAPDIL